MLKRIFILENIPLRTEHGAYNLLLVLLSYLVASLASYIALDFARHLANPAQQTISRRTIHFFGAFAMGAGIWSMHFIGMLAYQMKMSMSYDPLITFLSMIVAVVVAYYVLEVVKAEQMKIRSIFVSALLLGAGICAMHYSGMMAMQMDADLRYKPGLFALSAVIAIVASAAALIIAFKLARHNGKYTVLLKTGAAMVMGVAICGMHYTGLAAAVFIPYADCRYDPDQNFVGTATSIIVITLVILSAALFFSSELSRQGGSHSLIAKIIHRLFYRQTIFLVGVMVVLSSVVIFWQILRTKSTVEAAITHSLNTAHASKLHPILQAAMNELSMVLLAITIAATMFISFIIHMVRKREREIAQAKHALEQQLVEKTRMEKQLNDYVERMEISQYEMLEAKKNAEKSSLAKSDFLANMSHEIRTPMNGVLGMTGLILDTKLNAEQRGWAEIIRKSGENLLDIINDILDFSKIEAGKLTLEPIPFNLPDAIEEVTDVLRLRTQEKGLELLVQFDPHTPNFVLGDPGRLRQILINLIGNAIKFTRKGHVLINVAGENRNGKAHLFFAIHDTGIGIPDDKIDYVFQKFSQAEESTTRQFGGTGLGLTICKSLVELMDGTIGVRSITGEGSVFYFDILLPIVEEEAFADNIPPIDLTGRRIMVVDDYPINGEILCRYLRSWGTICEVFLSGTQALEAALAASNAGNPYEIALIDYRMDSMNGLQLAEKIHEQAALGEMLLIMITASTQVATPEELKRIGFSGFLTKPYYPDQLKAVLKIIIDAKAQNKPICLVTRHMISRIIHSGQQKQSDEIRQYPNRRLLVVEDIKVNLMLITKILEKHGIRVDAAANGLEAIEMLKKFSYDLVLMDCQMPEMDGFEATKAIRADETENKKTHTNIVALTADAMIGDREKCLGVGMDDYLNKPLKFHEVANLLDKWLGNHA